MAANLRKYYIASAVGVLVAVGIGAVVMLVPKTPGPEIKPQGRTQDDGAASGIRHPQTYNYKASSASPQNWGVPVRPMDEDILEAIAKDNLRRADMLDLFPDRPYHVKLIGNLEDKWISLVMIDLDRDGKWDERWEMKKDSVVRHTITGPDPGDSVPFELKPGRWLPY